MRSVWYVISIVLQDEENQKRGLVVINYNTGNCELFEESIAATIRWKAITKSLPLRFAGFHYCYSNDFNSPLLTEMQLVLQKNLLLRFRKHFGTFENVQFDLEAYGIPTECLPVTTEGEFLRTWHLKWVECRQDIEAHRKDHIFRLVPRRFDVLFGRGKTTRVHTGNLRASHLCEMYRAKYEQAGKFEKTEIAERIVSIILESFGRFLRWNSKKGWIEVSDEEARDKISHWFRRLRSEDGPFDKNVVQPYRCFSKRSILTAGT